MIKKHLSTLLALSVGLLMLTIIALQTGNVITPTVEKVQIESQDNMIQAKLQAVNDLGALGQPQVENYIMPNGTACPIKPISKLEEFFEYIRKPLYKCDNPKQFGGVKMGSFFDGDKWVCLDGKYDIKPNNCIALSFGINYEWSFDDALDKFGCKVYSFDPTMKKAQDHFRTPNIQFFKLGISNKEAVIGIGKVKSYAGIMKMLGLLDSNIDYLKMDVEGHEIAVFQSWFYDNPELLPHIKQIGMEIHPAKYLNNNEKIKKSTKEYFKYFQLLECFGFRLTFSNLNMVGSNKYMWKGTQQTCCYELVWVNTNIGNK